MPELSKSDQFAILNVQVRQENWLCLTAYICACSLQPLLLFLFPAIYFLKKGLELSAQPASTIAPFFNSAKIPDETSFISSSELKAFVPSPFVPKRDFVTLSFGRKSVIVYQDDAPQKSEQHLNAVINHELGHTGRLDIWFIVAAGISAAYLILFPIRRVLFEPDFFDRNAPLFPATHAIIAFAVLVSSSYILRKREYLADRYAWLQARKATKRFLSRGAALLSSGISRPANWIADFTMRLWHPSFETRLAAQTVGPGVNRIGIFWHGTFWAFSMTFLALFLMIPRGLLGGTTPYHLFVPLALMLQLFTYLYAGVCLHQISKVSKRGEWMIAVCAYGLGFATAQTYFFVGEEVFFEGQSYTHWHFEAWGLAALGWCAAMTMSGFVLRAINCGRLTWAWLSLSYALVAIIFGFFHILLLGAQSTDELPDIYPLDPMVAAPITVVTPFLICVAILIPTLIIRAFLLLVRQTIRQSVKVS